MFKKIKVSMILMVLLMSIFTISNKKVKAYINDTGHPLFDEIIIPDDRKVYLLVNSSLTTKKKQLSKVKWKLFGSSIHTEIYKMKVGFKRPNAFVRSNKTSNVIEYEYTFTSSLKTKYSFQKDEKSKLDISTKIKDFGLSLESEVNKALGITLESSVTQELNYTITISPYTKVTIYSTGEAFLSQGAMKYYVFGIPIYSTNWEQIEVIAEYYELYEEKYN